MEFYNLNEITYLKNSAFILQKIKEIKKILHKKNYTTDISSSIRVENKKILFDLRISFPLP